MINSFFTLAGFLSVGALIYYIINNGQYNTVFLPLLEGVITVGLLLIWLSYKKIKISLARKQITYMPIFVSVFILLLTVLLNLALHPFGSDRLVATNESGLWQNLISLVVQITFLPLGGVGIPLGMFISFLWPLLLQLGTIATIIILLIIPTLLVMSGVKKLLQDIQSQNSHDSIYICVVYPVLILSFIIPVSFILSYMRVQSVVTEENTWQMNRDSYENGKKIQHALEASLYRNDEYYETFPATLNKLVEWNLIDSIPLSPVNNRPYVYKLDPDGKNYTICFPQTEGERCERSWSRE